MAATIPNSRVAVTDGITLQTFEAGETVNAVIRGQQNRIHISKGAWLVSVDESLWTRHGRHLHTLLDKIGLLNDPNFAFIKLGPGSLGYDQWFDETTKTQKILYYMPREIVDKIENAGKVLDLMFEGKVRGKPLSEMLRNYQGRTRTRELYRRETTSYIG